MSLAMPRLVSPIHSRVNASILSYKALSTWLLEAIEFSEQIVSKAAGQT